MIKGLFMLTFIKNIFKRKEKIEINIFDKSLKSMSKAVAVIEIANEYLQLISKGKVNSPAYLRNINDSTFIEIWTDTRIEIFIAMIKCKKIDLAILGDIAKQNEILNIYFNEKPYLEFPYFLNKNVIHSSIQGIYLTYEYCFKIAWRVGAITIASTEKDKLNITNKFEEKLFELKIKLENEDFQNIDLIFDILFKDITRISKEIARTVAFGVEYNKTFEEMIKRGKDLTEKEKIANTFKYIISLEDPDKYKYNA